MAIGFCIKNAQYFNVVYTISIRESDLAYVVKVDSL